MDNRQEHRRYKRDFVENDVHGNSRLGARTNGWGKKRSTVAWSGVHEGRYDPGGSGRELAGRLVSGRAGAPTLATGMADRLAGSSRSRIGSSLSIEARSGGEADAALTGSPSSRDGVDEFVRREDDVRRAVAPAVLEPIEQAAVFEPGKALGRDRRTCPVAAQAFEAAAVTRAGTATLACTFTPPTLAQPLDILGKQWSGWWDSNPRLGEKA